MAFLKPNEGAVKGYKRVGRGASSGLGKTCGRGQKGQKARGKVPRLFEGGQTPFHMRFPITGLKRPHRREYFQLKLERVQDFWDRGRIPLEPGATLLIRVMRECGLFTGSLKHGVKVLSNGKGRYSVPLSIEASRASEAAIAAIEKTGHSFTARYFTRLSLLAHTKPDRFLLKKGYVPLPARPIHSRDIKYYSNPEKRGYLLQDRSLMLDAIDAAKLKKKDAKIRVHVTKDLLQRQLESASEKIYTDYAANTFTTLKSLLL